MAPSLRLIFLALACSTGTDAARVLRGMTDEANENELLTDMRPTVVATMLANMQDSWVQHRSEAIAGVGNEQLTRGQMLVSCEKVATAVLQASDGNWKKVTEYMQEVCEKDQYTNSSNAATNAVHARELQMCQQFGTGIAKKMTGDENFNRNNVDMSRFCRSFYDSAVTAAAHAFHAKQVMEKERQEAEDAKEEEAEAARDEKDRAADEAEDAKVAAEKKAAEEAKAKAEKEAEAAAEVEAAAAKAKAAAAEANNASVDDASNSTANSSVDVETVVHADEAVEKEDDGVLTASEDTAADWQEADSIDDVPDITANQTVPVNAAATANQTVPVNGTTAMVNANATEGSDACSGFQRTKKAACASCTSEAVKSPGPTGPCTCQVGDCTAEMSKHSGSCGSDGTLYFCATCVPVKYELADGEVSTHDVAKDQGWTEVGLC